MTTAGKGAIGSAELKEMLIDAFSDPEKVVFDDSLPTKKAFNEDSSIYVYRDNAMSTCAKVYCSSSDCLFFLCLVVLPNPKQYQIAKPYYLTAEDARTVLAAYHHAYSMAVLL